MTITVSPTWQRAMQRALVGKQKPTRRVDGSYRVPSQSSPGTVHTVTLDGAGHIAGCTCNGWEAYGRRNPCRHAGAVALAIAFLAGAHIAPQSELPIESPRRGRTQIFHGAA